MMMKMIGYDEFPEISEKTHESVLKYKKEISINTSLLIRIYHRVRVKTKEDLIRK